MNSADNRRMRADHQTPRATTSHHTVGATTPTEVSDPLLVPVASGPVNARVTLPGSKSYTNRALPIAALATGKSTLFGALDSDDTRYMVAALQLLGISIDVDGVAGTIVVSGSDGQIPFGCADLFLGNSGTSMRFLAALVALGKGRFRLDGTERMRERPLGPLIDGLRRIGITIDCDRAEGYPPITITASGLPGGVISMPGNISSQFFSALAIVLPYAREPLAINVIGDLVSKPYIDLTADAMAAFGVRLNIDQYQQLWVDPGSHYQGTEYVIEPDASAASYFFALAAVTGGCVTVERLPPTSRQGDLKFVDILERMGCHIVRDSTNITVHGPERLKGIDVDMNQISDTVQTLAAIAPFASGPVTIRNVGHIRLKETDRLYALTTELRRLRVPVEESQDGIAIYPAEPQPETVQTYDDHRMAMSFAITGTRAPGIRIADPGCVSKTVPAFWQILLPLLINA